MPGGGRWVELADGVFARRHDELDLTTGLLVGTERCLVIDTRGDLDQGAELAAAVRTVTPLPWTLVYTHAHFDHAWGAEAFLPTHVWGHRDCARDLLAQAEAVRAEWIDHYRGEGKFDTADALARTTVVAPDRTFTTRVELSLGGRTVVLLHPGPAHTGHDIVVHVPDAGVLFAGDVVEHAETGFSVDSFGSDTHLASWPDTLDVLLGLDPDIVVPGHGEPVGAPFVRRHRDGLRELVTLRDALNRHRMTRQEALAASPYPADVTEAALVGCHV